MFSNPFSFDGRIRRTEYGLSFIMYVFAAAILNIIVAVNKDLTILFVAYIPMLWFLWAQGAKRCHDVGNSGWWQLIPFYPLWLLFQDSKPGYNEYGANPKNIGNHDFDFNSGYQSGGYSGGHNNPNASYNSYESQNQSNDYKSGDLYK